MYISRGVMLIVALCGVITGILYVSHVERFRQSTTVGIVLTAEGFSPSEVHIRRGDSIKFSTNLDSQYWPASNLHPDHSIYPEFDPRRPLQSGESWTFMFQRVGTWRFHDHLRSYFVGTIYVED